MQRESNRNILVGIDPGIFIRSIHTNSKTYYRDIQLTVPLCGLPGLQRWPAIGCGRPWSPRQRSCTPSWRGWQGVDPERNVTNLEPRKKYGKHLAVWFYGKSKLSCENSFVIETNQRQIVDGIRMKWNELIHGGGVWYGVTVQKLR